MPQFLKRTALASLAAAAVAGAPLVMAHFDDDQPLQSYRQSYFTLVAMNFGPMASMVKGDIPWDQEALEGYADDLDDIVELDLLRGFAPGSEKGKTRARPEIWDNMDDFEAKYADLQEAAAALDEAAESGDREAIAGAVKDVGGACKACHDEYKAKDYLY